VTLAGNYGVISADQSDFAYDGDAKCTVKRFDEIYSAAATHDIATPDAAKKVRLRSLDVRPLSATSVGVYFKTEDGTATLLGTNASNPQTLDMDGVDGPQGFIKQHNPDGWAETETAGKAFQIVLDAAVPVAVNGTYIEVD